VTDIKDDESDKEDAGPTDIPGGLPPEKVEDRPDVSQVTPEDYPLGPQSTR
jgi:hypothetical protein